MRDDQNRWQHEDHPSTAGAELPGDAAGGAGVEWRGRLEELRERRKERRKWTERLREPLIGLTMAGAAAPLAYGVKQMQPEGPGPQRSPGDVASGRQATEGDIEDAVGNRWAQAQADQARSDTVTGAMTRYDIDRPLAEAIYDAAVEEGIEPEIAYGLVKTESTFRDRAVSHVGARGLTQVMPRTARWLMPDLIKSPDQLFEAETNLKVGFTYLRYLLDKYDEDVRLALLAYNRGPGTVDRILDRGGDPDNGYADKVLRG